MADAVKVYISYGHYDRVSADELGADLFRAGIRVLFERADAVPADDWLPSKDKLIASVDVVIVCLTAASVEERSVAYDIELARTAGKPLLPVRVGAFGESSIPEYLASVQWFPVGRVYDPRRDAQELAATILRLAGRAEDDLKRIRGIGILLEKKLNSLGVKRYADIAAWTHADVERMSIALDFKGRIEREEWVLQAKVLAAGGLEAVSGPSTLSREDMLKGSELESITPPKAGESSDAPDPAPPIVDDPPASASGPASEVVSIIKDERALVLRRKRAQVAMAACLAIVPLVAAVSAHIFVSRMGYHLTSEMRPVTTAARLLAPQQPAHSSAISDMTVSDDGSLIATLGADHLVKVWDMGTGRLRWQASTGDQGEPPSAVVFVRRGDRLLLIAAIMSSTAGGAIAFDAGTGEEATFVEDLVQPVLASRDQIMGVPWTIVGTEQGKGFGTHIVYAGRWPTDDALANRDVSLMAGSNGRVAIGKGAVGGTTPPSDDTHMAAIVAASVRPDLAQAVTADEAGAVVLWTPERVRKRDAPTGKNRSIEDAKSRNAEESDQWKPTPLLGKPLTAGADGETTRDPVCGGPCTTAIYSADSALLLTAGLSGTARVSLTENPAERFWRVNHGAPVNVARFRTAPQLGAGGQKLLDVVTAGDDGAAKLWRIDLSTAAGATPDMRPLVTIRGHGAAITHAMVTSDGRHLVTGDIQGAVRITDLEAAELIGRVDVAEPLELHVLQPARRAINVVTASLDRAWRELTIRQEQDALPPPAAPSPRKVVSPPHSPDPITGHVSANPPALSDDQVRALISQEARNLIIGFEVTSQDHYERNLRTPEWPGGESGITIGISYDVGYASPGDMARDLEGLLDPTILKRLVALSGLRGEEAKAQLPAVADIVVPWDVAVKIFERTTMVRQGRAVLNTFPNAELLPPDCFGALVSLVFNRGTVLDGDRRVEMRNIRDHMANKEFAKIPAEFRSMKRLWAGTNLTGMLKRRDVEADLFERGLVATADKGTR